MKIPNRTTPALFNFYLSADSNLSPLSWNICEKAMPIRLCNSISMCFFVSNCFATFVVIMIVSSGELLDALDGYRLLVPGSEILCRKDE